MARFRDGRTRIPDRHITVTDPTSLSYALQIDPGFTQALWPLVGNKAAASPTQ